MSGPMHEPTAPVRERPASAAGASRTAPGWAEARRGFLIAVIAAVFMAFTGAFGSDDAAWLRRFAYWLALMLVGAGMGAAASTFVGRRGWLDQSDWLQGALIVAIITPPLTLFNWAFTRLMFERAYDVRSILWFVPPVLAVSAAMTALNYLVSRTPPETHAAPAGAAPVRFLERLPPKLRGADIYAVEAEDHYLRLHTSQGSDLILLRLADAVAELEGIEGAQTHRSWWVARGAVVSAARGGRPGDAHASGRGAGAGQPDLRQGAPGGGLVLSRWRPAARQLGVGRAEVHRPGRRPARGGQDDHARERDRIRRTAWVDAGARQDGRKLAGSRADERTGPGADQLGEARGGGLRVQSIGRHQRLALGEHLDPELTAAGVNSRDHEIPDG
jgi:hypothetical protein